MTFTPLVVMLELPLSGTKTRTEQLMANSRETNTDRFGRSHGDANGELTRRQTLMLGLTAATVTAISGMLRFDALAAEEEGSWLDLVFVLYPKFTLLDFAGANEVFARLPNIKVRVASPDGGAITSDTNVVLGETIKLSEVKACDLLCVPGGTDRSTMMRSNVQEHLRRLATGAKYVTSICNGSLILGAAGLLEGHRSACHWAQLTLLKQYGAIPDSSRVVKDGRFMSGGGVTAGIDFALAVGAELSGPVQAEIIQLLMEYEPAPPFHAGRPESAPPEVLAAFKKQYVSLATTAGL